MREQKLYNILSELDDVTEGYPTHIRELYHLLVNEIETQHAEWEAEEDELNAGVETDES